MEDSKKEESEDKDTKILVEAVAEMEKSFGLGTSKKSKLVSRGFTLNEIVNTADQ